MLRPGSDFGLNLRNLQLYRVVGLEYVREVFGIEYKIENYDNKVECEVENKGCKKIERSLIVNLEEYNIK